MSCKLKYTYMERDPGQKQQNGCLWLFCAGALVIPEKIKDRNDDHYNKMNPPAEDMGGD